MEHRTPIVRAVDVGYGHVKFTDGRDAEGSRILTDSIPSQSPPAQRHGKKESLAMGRRDTFIVPVGGRLFEVGRDVRLALHSNHESEVLDGDFPLSDPYAARLYGAVNYMLPSLPSRTIDVLVLGLPLNTFPKHHEALAKKFVGPHVINERGDTIDIKHCCVYPQPFGSYSSYIAETTKPLDRSPMALIVDPGYNTVDWFVCHGTVANEIRSDAVQRGMGAVLRAIADDIIKKNGYDAQPAEVVRLIDRALVSGRGLEMYGTPLDLKDYMAAGNDVIEEAAQAVKNNVGSGSDIDVILLSGGGASIYYQAIASKFPMHRVELLASPALANVRGFQLIGEKVGRSRVRATQAA